MSKYNRRPGYKRRGKKSPTGPVLLVTIAAVLVAAAIAFGRGGAGDATPRPTPANTPVSGTPAPLSELLAGLPAFEATATAAGSAAVTLENCLQNSAFLGNSILGAVQRGGYAPESAVFAGTGINVRTALDTPADGRSVPMIDELNGAEYARVFTLFGINELEWPNRSALVTRYIALLGAIRERCPGAQIYVISILPVVREYESASGVTMEDVTAMNAQLSQMCEEQGVHFLDVTAAMADTQGFLPDEATSDGYHLRSSYAEILVNEIRRQVVEWESE